MSESRSSWVSSSDSKPRTPRAPRAHRNSDGGTEGKGRCWSDKMTRCAIKVEKYIFSGDSVVLFVEVDVSLCRALPSSQIRSEDPQVPLGYINK